jgi:AcrR family transcriptional regulator
MDDVARAMGVTKGVIYYYFRSKEEICAEVVCIAIEGAIRRLAAVTAEGGPAAETLRKAVAVHAEYNLNDQEEGYYAMLVAHDVRTLSRASRARVRALQKTYSTAFTEIVRRGVDEGTLIDRDPHVTALTLITAANYVSDWFRATGPMDIERVVNHVADQLVGGVLRPEVAHRQA